MNTRKICLITGASDGIGYEFARLFAQDSYNLILVARNEARLRKIAMELEEKYNIYVKVIPKDLSAASSPDEIFEETEKDGLIVNTLVNNAGFDTKGPFLETDIKMQLQMIQVNLTTLTHLTYLYGKKMASSGEGKIINVASTAAFQPGPLMAVYYASKAYVLSLSEALSNEFKQNNIVVTALCPGIKESEFYKQSALESAELPSEKKVMNAEDTAKEGYFGLKEKRSVVIPGLQNKISAFGSRLLPRFLAAKLARKLQERRA